MPSYRKNRIDEAVRNELAAIVRELKDPRIGDFVTVVRVDVTPDQRYARAYISSINEDAMDGTLAGLRSAAGFIRREVTRRCGLRSAPEFSFIADHSIAHGVHIAQILKEINPGEESD